MTKATLDHLKRKFKDKFNPVLYVSGGHYKPKASTLYNIGKEVAHMLKLAQKLEKRKSEDKQNPQLSG